MSRGRTESILVEWKVEKWWHDDGINEGGIKSNLITVKTGLLVLIQG